MPYKDPEKTKEYQRRYSREVWSGARGEELKNKKRASGIRRRVKHPEKKRVYTCTYGPNIRGYAPVDITTIRPMPLDSVCECCRRKATMALDHCHDTGKFRGWVCTPCNAGIGMLGDNIAGVELALEYLRRAS